MLEVNSCFKVAQKDNWANGQSSTGGVSFDVPVVARAANIDALVKQLNESFDCDYVVVGACDETDRIDFSRMEDDNGDRVYEGDALDVQWKAGEIDLWAATYTVAVEVVERNPATLEPKEYKL